MNREAKLGVALSGGGFRAALFHLGVLAQMADLGLLRHVEVISTVSGGSIIGAFYYLHVKRLLEEKADNDIKDSDYQMILSQIERDFLTGVQKNLRMRTFLNLRKVFRMALANYSRSDRIGELYDEYFYRPVFNKNRSHPIQMRELLIRPKVGEKNVDFNPQEENASRSAKVPILVINATTLNTGHNWRFEAVRMGEPPHDDETAKEIDANLRLRRPPSYETIEHTGQHTFELGLAVAASACVPALFPPLAVSNLYPYGIRVQLVDGGVHDNQGVEGLCDMGCTHFVVSDACGCMKDEYLPGTSTLPVVLRSNAILMDRVREEELFRVYDSKRPLAFLHLLKWLPGKGVSWVDRTGSPAQMDKPERVPEAPPPSFKVPQNVQNLLACVRTDLDSFTDVEAFSLMLEGYQMSKSELQKLTSDKDGPAATTERPSWRFSRIEPWMRSPTPPYLRQLEVASQNMGKVFLLSWPVAGITVLLVALGLGGIGAVWGDVIKAWLSSPITFGGLLLMILLLGLGFVPQFAPASTIFRFLRSPTEVATRIVLKIALPVLGWLFVVVHLYVFDRLFLRQGKIERLGTLPEPTA